MFIFLAHKNLSLSSGFNPRSRHTKDFKNGTWSLLANTQQYEVRIKGKMEQSRERSSALVAHFSLLTYLKPH